MSAITNIRTVSCPTLGKLPLAEKPYLSADRIAAPKSVSDRLTKRCPQASNCARCHEVLSCVARRVTPMA